MGFGHWRFVLRGALENFLYGPLWSLLVGQFGEESFFVSRRQVLA